MYVYKASGYMGPSNSFGQLEVSIMALSGVCEACGRKTMTVQMSVRGHQMVCSSCSRGQVHGVIRGPRITRSVIRRAA